LSSGAAGAEGAFGCRLFIALSLAECVVFAGFAASSRDGAAFELALLGAIAGSTNGGRQMLELALLGKLIQRGNANNVSKV
jgi:hypothetical protein